MTPRHNYHNRNSELTGIYLRVSIPVLILMARSRYQTIQEMYLEPVGISRQRFTWSKATAAGIAARNPSDVTVGGFQTVRDADQAPPPWPASMPPFPIVGTTLLGPKALAPYPSNNKSYTLLEITPLYVGMPVQHNITYYHHHLLHTDEALNRTVGGYLEPFAFGGPAPSRGLPPHVLTGLLQVPRPSYNFSVPSPRHKYHAQNSGLTEIYI